MYFVPAAFRSLPLSLAGVAGFPSPSSLCVSRSPCWLNLCVCEWLLQVAATSTMEGSLMALLADPSRKLLTPRECRAYAAGSGSGRSLSLQLGPLGKPLAAISPYNNKARSKTEKEWRSMKAKVRARLWRGAFWASRPTRLRRGAVRSTLPWWIRAKPRRRWPAGMLRPFFWQQACFLETLGMYDASGSDSSTPQPGILTW